MCPDHTTPYVFITFLELLAHVIFFEHRIDLYARAYRSTPSYAPAFMRKLGYYEI
jgi:hypothetical protein